MDAECSLPCSQQHDSCPSPSLSQTIQIPPKPSYPLPLTPTTILFSPLKSTYFRWFLFFIFPIWMVGWDSSVGIVTPTARRLNPGGGKHFQHIFRTALGITQGPVEWVLCHSGEQSGRNVTLTSNPNLAPSLKKEYTYKLLPSPPGRGGMYYGEFFYHGQKP
jgi:hypothetical protein